MNKKKAIIVAGVITSAISAATGVYFLKPGLVPGFGGQEDSGVQLEGDKARRKEATEIGADLDVFVVNLASSGESRYLRTTLTLGVKDTHQKEKIKEFIGPIRHAIIMYLTGRKVEELNDPEGKEKLRHALHDQINNAIGDSMVSSVYFKEFLIQ